MAKIVSLVSLGGSLPKWRKVECLTGKKMHHNKGRQTLLIKLPFLIYVFVKAIFMFEYNS